MDPSRDAIVSVASRLLQSKGIQVSSHSILQNLWAGYGKIARIETSIGPLIVKYVQPPTKTLTTMDEGHLRKVISYEVEQYFYSQLAPSLPPEAAVADCLASINERSTDSSKVAMVLSDLRGEFPIAGEKRGSLIEVQVHAALNWLATFHGHFWARSEQLKRDSMRLPPLEESKLQEVGDGVWLNGGYTYLATRQTEYKSLAEDTSSEWSKALCQAITGSPHSIAELVALILSPSPTSDGYPTAEYETLIHGDVKSENLFTTKDGTSVAFYDFQYVGLGLGTCDLAKLFTCSVPLDMLTREELGVSNQECIAMGEGERRLLERYRHLLQRVSAKGYPWEDLKQHWETALVDWLRFQASWGFWGNTEWLEARVRHILRDEEWLRWVQEAAMKKSAA